MDFQIGDLPIPITFAPSDSIQRVPLEIIEDSITEGNEIFTLILSLASSTLSSIQIGQNSTQVTIEDNDSKGHLCSTFEFVVQYLEPM